MYSSHHGVSVCFGVAQSVKSFWLTFLEDCISWTCGWIRYIHCLMLVWSFMLYHHDLYQWPWGQGVLTFLLNFKLKFLVKVFRSLYLLKLMLDLVIVCLMLDTGLKFYAVPSWSTSWPWGQGDGLWNIKFKFLVKVLEVCIFWSFSSCWLSTGLKFNAAPAPPPH